jgi:hypothetical protein
MTVRSLIFLEVNAMLPLTPYGGKYDELLTAAVVDRKRTDRGVSQNGLTFALKRATGLSIREARRAVDDYCARGALQALLGDGPFDPWLTQRLEGCYLANRGISVVLLAKELRRAHPETLVDANLVNSGWAVSTAAGLANAVDVVEEYFARHALKHVLGPFPLAGVLIVTGFELLLMLPIAWIIHTAFVLLVPSLSAHAYIPTDAFLLLLVGEQLLRNWRRTRSRTRWGSYEAARESLLERYGIGDVMLQ